MIGFLLGLAVGVFVAVVIHCRHSATIRGLKARLTDYLGWDVD